MKKKIVIILLLISLFCLKMNVYASNKYINGIVKSTANMYADSGLSKRIYSDIGNAITLYTANPLEILEEGSNYYKVYFMYSGFTYTGYVNKSNIIKNEYDVDDAYIAELVSKGFPQDYAKKLAILHAIHPNWTFVPSNTGKIEGGLDFNTAVQKEAEVVSRNLIDSANTSLRSTEDGAYNNGTWISLSGSRWFAASRQTISFFLDPRNFLDEAHIFMFENLGYNPVTQTREVVNKIIGSSFMNDPFECITNSYICSVGTHYYVDSFLQAGVDKSVSPVHLATRVIQEQGSKGSILSLGKGYKGNYVGYYNFYNIGASGKTDEEVITNGLTYAYNRKWNNQHASIYDGSSTIASNYIKIGQSSLYYQKFNTILQNYSHQYQQNVKAPFSEGYNTYVNYYKSYSSLDEWNNAVYEFLIPIYSNMPASTTLDVSGNADATLKVLNIPECKLNPSFQSSAYEYECYTKKDTTELQIEAIATNSLAKVDDVTKVTLDKDEVKVEIGVTAASGNKSVYIINVHRIDTDGYSPSEIINGIGYKLNGNYVTNIELGTDMSNIINSIQNKYHFSSIDIMNGANGKVKTGYKITIANAGITGTYSLVLYGDISGDGEIDIRDLLIIQKHLVKARVLADEYIESADINHDGNVDIRDLLLEQKYLLNQYTISQG